MTMPDDEKAKETARKRHLALTYVSFFAAFMAAGGAFLVSDRGPDAVPEAVGYAVIVQAIVIFFFLPNWLRKKWRERDANEDGQ
jgi:hypothetical protein